MSEQEKKVACTETLQIYYCLCEEEKVLIPRWLVESLERYWDPEIAKRRTVDEINNNLKKNTIPVTYLLMYFAYECNEKELNSFVTYRNRDFLIDLLSYKMDEKTSDTDVS